MTAERPRVLFLCVHNSCRSQMAEGWARHLAGDRLEAHSAGLEATRVHPLAVQVMAEAGVDISRQRSKAIDDLPEHDFHVVVTTCEEAAEACPSWPGAARVVHWSLPDPAAIGGPEARKLAGFRQVRDAIRERVAALVEDVGRGE